LYTKSTVLMRMKNRYIGQVTMHFSSTDGCLNQKSNTAVAVLVCILYLDAKLSKERRALVTGLCRWIVCVTFCSCSPFHYVPVPWGFAPVTTVRALKLVQATRRSLYTLLPARRIKPRLHAAFYLLHNFDPFPVGQRSDY